MVDLPTDPVAVDPPDPVTIVGVSAAELPLLLPVGRFGVLALARGWMVWLEGGEPYSPPCVRKQMWDSDGERGFGEPLTIRRMGANQRGGRERCHFHTSTSV